MEERSGGFFPREYLVGAARFGSVPGLFAAGGGAGRREPLGF